MDAADNPPEEESLPQAEAQRERPALLPEIDISHILGLVELLNSKGGRDDIYKLANELSMEFGELHEVIRSAELLDLVHTPGGDVVLEELGEKLSRVKVNERKKMICEQIEKIPVIQKVVAFLNSQEGHEATKEEVKEILAELIPNENVEESFSSLVSWGRYAELFGYSDDTQTFYLDEEEEVQPKKA